jgi:hypothetical protein
LKVAVTDLLASIVTVHGPVVVHVVAPGPLQPAKTPFPFVLAVSVTVCTLVANVAVHLLPQLMPAGLLVTVPLAGAVPLLVTVSVFVATAAPIVNGNAFDAVVDPGLVAVTWAVPAAEMSAAVMAAVT